MELRLCRDSSMLEIWDMRECLVREIPHRSIVVFLIRLKCREFFMYRFLSWFKWVHTSTETCLPYFEGSLSLFEGIHMSTETCLPYFEGSLSLFEGVHTSTQACLSYFERGEFFEYESLELRICHRWELIDVCIVFFFILKSSFFPSISLGSVVDPWVHDHHTRSRVG